ncbi:MAG: hypothetical protein WBQ19_04475 [Terriglobales bacterium]|jgi:hypothetical protein
MTNTNTTFLNGALCNDAPVNDEAVSDSFMSNTSSGGNPPSISQGNVSTEYQGGAMSDESKNEHEPESAASGAESSTQQPEASSKDTSLSKPEPTSPPTVLQNKSKNAIASANTFVVKVDASTGKITLNGNLQIFGTNDRDSTLALTNQVAGVVQTNAGGGFDSHNLGWALGTIYRIAPQDEIEGLLSTQMVCVHSLAMQCLKRASRGDKTTGETDANINCATKLLRTFATLKDARDHHRGKVGQPMVVGSVNVNEGGQAIVGPVSQGGRGKASTDNDPDKTE